MRLVTCALVVMGLFARPVAADDAPAFRAVIDRVELEPATVTGYRLRVALSALALGGQLLDLSDHKSIKLSIGGSKIDAPYALGSYGATDAETAIVFVVQANLAYADALPVILDSLDQTVLAALGDRAQIAVLPYGDATGAGKLAPIKTARGRVSQVGNDGSASEPALLDTLDRALLLLKRAKVDAPKREGADPNAPPRTLPLRKLIVVVGDGRDRSGDRERVTRLGRRAEKEGVRIHTLGYAPSNIRRPLLTLGELSRRSLGTFRWVRGGGGESWGPAFQQLRDEIVKQNVVTFFLPPDTDASGKKLKIVAVGRVEATSNELVVPEPSCNGEACGTGYCAGDRCVVPKGGGGRGVLGWILLVGGIVVAVLVGLGVIGYFIQKRQQQPQLPQVPGNVTAHLPAGFPAPRVQPVPAMQAAPPPQVQRTGPALLVISGPRAGLRLMLHNGFTIGKAAQANLQIDDGYTSTDHAQIGVDGNYVCRIYDRNSTNGTYVNGVRVTEVELAHGMTVRIGSTDLQFLAQ